MSDRPRRLERNLDDKVIAGVASGVADFFGLDPTLVRVIWALTVLIGGFGIVAYAVLWLVMPEGSSEHSVVHDLRDKPQPSDASEPSEPEEPSSD